MPSTRKESTSPRRRVAALVLVRDALDTQCHDNLFCNDVRSCLYCPLLFKFNTCSCSVAPSHFHNIRQTIFGEMCLISFHVRNGLLSPWVPRLITGNLAPSLRQRPQASCFDSASKRAVNTAGKHLNTSLVLNHVHYFRYVFTPDSLI